MQGDGSLKMENEFDVNTLNNDQENKLILQLKCPVCGEFCDDHNIICKVKKEILFFRKCCKCETCFKIPVKYKTMKHAKGILFFVKQSNEWNAMRLL